jgi:NitT/TauT family transport system ATP-binding protein
LEEARLEGNPASSRNFPPGDIPLGLARPDKSVRGASITFQGVSHTYSDLRSGGSTKAIEEFSLSIAQGSFVCLLGPSGCGKSTLLNLLAGFEKPTGGRILVEGQEVLKPGPDRGVVFQEPNLLPWRRVIANITLGPDLAGAPKAETLKKAREFIRLTGLNGFENHAPYELSGGMKQRVALARAWISEPPILVMDEPFGALDAQTRMSMQELLLDIWDRTGSTVLFVTHDVDEALFLSDRIIVITPRPGRIARDILSPLSRPRLYDNLFLRPDYAGLKQEILLAMRHPDYFI